VKAHDSQLESTRQYVAAKLTLLPDEDVQTISAALDLLQSVFQKRETAEG